MKKVLLAQFILFIGSICLLAVNPVNQVIKGKIIDSDTKITLPGATIALLDSEQPVGCTSDLDGFFKLENVTVGRCGIKVSYVGYQTKVIENMMLKSGKELILTVELEEKYENIDEVEIKAFNGKEDALNEMAMISARSFNVEETEKYAGSWGDPSRMATNYAGVFVGNDQGNDIIIRGNSPSGLIWSLEGIPIPSPNHWDRLGTTGGPVSMVNNNLLSRSDFFTSAFPAEYGNGLSGVFDLKMRNGNYEKREYLAQLGFNGFEFGAEGPFIKGSKASYLINYRHSMLGLVDQLLWVDGLPYYKDLTMKVNIPYQKGNISIFGIAGNSEITFSDTIQSNDGVVHELQFPNGSKTGVAGINYTHFINNKTRVKTSLAITTRRPFSKMDSVANGEPVKNFYTDTEVENKYILKTKLISKLNSKNIIDVGIALQNYSLEIFEEDFDYNRENDSVMYFDPYKVKENNMLLMQGFVQLKHHLAHNISITTGLNYQQFTYNNTYSIEPRIGIKWNIFQNQSINFGYGLHSQIQPLYIYAKKTFEENELNTKNVFVQTNKNLDFSKSHHYVIGYDYSINQNLRVKTELYYQDLFNIPVERRESYFSMINTGESLSSINRDSLINKGTGENYGLEFTLEKFLHKNYYFLVTTSLFNSTYKGSDEIKRNTVYNGNYVVNVLGGYEYPLNDHSSLSFNLRVVNAGGRRYIPVDLEKSIAENSTVYIFEKAFEDRVSSYFRTDFRIGYMYHGKKATHEIALDITNLTNHQNEYARYYSSFSKEIEIEYQQGFFPMGLYRVNF
ncbi:carboxypeptidase-like regulatory domain-containing protein [Bacteroidota bacterium]